MDIFDCVSFMELQILLSTDSEKLLKLLEANDEIRPIVTGDVITTDEQVNGMLQCLVCGRFNEILKIPKVTELLCLDSTASNWEERVTDSLNAFMNKEEEFCNDRYNLLFVLFIGVAALQHFIKLNWTGPIDITQEHEEFVPNVNSTNEEIPLWKKNVMSSLHLCNEDVYPLIRSPQLLLLAKIILYKLNLPMVSSSWWKMRYLCLHQSLLQERNSAVYSKVSDAVNEAIKSPVHNNKNILIQLHIEAALACLNFHDISKAKQYLKIVQEESGLSVKLSGALGNRTQFQQIPYSQLFLLTETEKSTTSLYTQNATDLPTNIRLQDDTLLNKVKFVQSTDNDNKSLLRAEDQAIILALSFLHQKRSAHDDLLNEELMAYADFLLSDPKNYCIQFCALLLRSKLEKLKSKKVERAMMQVQSLTDQMRNNSGDSSNRQQLFYSTVFPPFWVLEKELANLLLSLGSIKGALEVFLRLEMWEECIFCYKQLQRNDKALSIIEKQLEKGETPLLLCLKGDVTNDPECYEKAWELSKHHSSRAKRSLGYYYFHKKEYKECIPHLLESLEIDSLEQRAWFLLGHAATQLEDYQLAARCYRSLINLDPDSFEAWNNLSNAYIRLNDKLRAWHTLQEAIKCNFEEWRVWENYLLVCMDVGAFEEAINAFHRLVDIKGKHTDQEVTQILVSAIVRNLKDIHDQPASLLMDKALKLLGHITAADTSNAKTWSCYSLLLEYKSDTNKDDELLDRVIQYRQKALNLVKNEAQKTGSHKCIETLKEFLLYSSKLCETYLKRYKSMDNKVQATQLLHSAKLMLKNTLSLANRELDNFDTSEVNEMVRPSIVDLEDKLSEVLKILE